MDQVTRFRTIGPTTYLCPIPGGDAGLREPEDGAPNLITVAWTGVVCSKPPMLSVSIRKSRLSHDMIARTGEFTLNLTSRALCRAMDFCRGKKRAGGGQIRPPGPYAHGCAGPQGRARRGRGARVFELSGPFHPGAGQP